MEVGPCLSKWGGRGCGAKLPSSDARRSAMVSKGSMMATTEVRPGSSWVLSGRVFESVGKL
jgi:hypothetical protein